VENLTLNSVENDIGRIMSLCELFGMNFCALFGIILRRGASFRSPLGPK
jgi:hypothetical protein